MNHLKLNFLSGSSNEYGKCHNKEPDICVPNRPCPGPRRGSYQGGPSPGFGSFGHGRRPMGAQHGPYYSGYPRPYFPALRPIPTIPPLPAIPSFGNQFGQNNHNQNTQGAYGQQNRPNSPRPQPKRNTWENGQSWGNNDQQRPKWGNSGYQTGQEWPNQIPNQPNDWRRPK